MALSPQGYNYGIDPTSTNPFWDDTPDTTTWLTGISMTETDGTYTITATDNTGATSAVGTITPQTGVYVTGVTMTNEDGIYTLTATLSDGTSQAVGTVEVPEQQDISNLIAEVNDAIVENTTDGYDYHTITETENGGTRNNVGSFYIARNQIVALGLSVIAPTGSATEYSFGLKSVAVNQSGETVEQGNYVGTASNVGVITASEFKAALGITDNARVGAITLDQLYEVAQSETVTETEGTSVTNAYLVYGTGWYITGQTRTIRFTTTEGDNISTSVDGIIIPSFCAGVVATDDSTSADASLICRCLPPYIILHATGNYTGAITIFPGRTWSISSAVGDDSSYETTIRLNATTPLITFRAGTSTSYPFGGADSTDNAGRMQGLLTSASDNTVQYHPSGLQAVFSYSGDLADYTNLAIAGAIRL